MPITRARVTLGAVTLMLLTGCGGSSDDPGPVGATTSADPGPTGSEPPRPRPDPSPPSGPSDVPAAVERAAHDAAADFAEALSGALADPGTVLADDLPIAGAAREALEAQAAELERSGWRIQGRPRVVSVEVRDRAADRLVVGACLDDSGTTVVDQSGRVVRDGADRSPTLHLLTLVREGSGWVVVESTFPSDPDC